MAKDKPYICRCSFCYERFEKPLKQHYKQPNEPGSKGNCLSTYELFAQGWRQSPTGVWVKL